MRKNNEAMENAHIGREIQTVDERKDAFVYADVDAYAVKIYWEYSRCSGSLIGVKSHERMALLSSKIMPHKLCNLFEIIKMKQLW